jgi:hypothetical protein
MSRTEADTRHAVRAAPTRDIRIDSLRGLMLAQMMLLHSGSPMGRACFEVFGRVSPAAGFVFLSGLVAGAVYSRTVEHGAAAIVRRSASRALYIHAYHLAVFVTLLAVVLIEPRAAVDFSFPIAHLQDALRLLGAFAVWYYQPLHFGVLPMYALFVLAMPAALLALFRGRGRLMLLVSLGIWALAQVGLGRLAPGAGPFGFFHGYFNPFAWQFVFFSGLFIGHMHLYRRRPWVVAQPAFIVLCMLVCLAGFTMRWHLLPWPSPFERGSWLASKQDYGLLYLVNFLAFAYLVYCLGLRAPRAFAWRPLAFLGRHSLQVFSFHILAVYLTLSLARSLHDSPLMSNMLGVALVASLFGAAWCHASWPAMRQRLTKLGRTRLPVAGASGYATRLLRKNTGENNRATGNGYKPFAISSE